MNDWIAYFPKCQAGLLGDDPCVTMGCNLFDWNVGGVCVNSTAVIISGGLLLLLVVMR